MMSHLIELPDDVYNALEEAAASCGTTPAKWLADQLREQARLAATVPSSPIKTRCDVDCDDVFWHETATSRPR